MNTVKTDEQKSATDAGWHPDGIVHDAGLGRAADVNRTNVIDHKLPPAGEADIRHDADAEHDAYIRRGAADLRRDAAVRRESDIRQGAVPGQICPRCAGTGSVNAGPMCRDCEGTGKLLKRPDPVVAAAQVVQANVKKEAVIREADIRQEADLRRDAGVKEADLRDTDAIRHDADIHHDDLLLRPNVPNPKV